MMSKKQNQTADLYFDDDDEETDDIQVEDKMDFSQFSDEDFLNADDKTISLMGNETFILNLFYSGHDISPYKYCLLIFKIFQRILCPTSAKLKND